MLDEVRAKFGSPPGAPSTPNHQQTAQKKRDEFARFKKTQLAGAGGLSKTHLDACERLLGVSDKQLFARGLLTAANVIRRLK